VSTVSATPSALCMVGIASAVLEHTRCVYVT
jgi:hypothetical protein